MMSLQATSKKRGHQGEWVSLVLPWLSIVTVACLAAVYYSTVADDNAATGGKIHRDMLVQDYSHPHEHKQVFKEEHAPLFPLTTSDYYGFFFAVAGLMVAAGGGIGGGGILVPIYILIFGFSPKHAIPLSNITVFGGACANVLLNTPKRHPFVDRPLVDWDLILVMEPLTIAGALIGAFLNKVLPELLLTFMLVVLLSFTAYSTLKKARRMYQAETVAKKQLAANRRESELTAMLQQKDTDQDEEATDKLLDNVEEPEQGEEQHQDGGEKPKEVEQPKKEEPPEVVQRREELEQILEDERHTPSANLSILVTMFVVVLTINLLKGGGAFPSPLGIRCGSTGFWIANAIMLAWILTISAFVRQYLLRKYEAKARCGFSYVEGDIQWDARATVVYPVVCCAAGFFAGMFGVGGGIVKGPLMLAMGVHPAVSAASSATMILFTSFTATTSFVAFGLLVFDYGVVCLCVGFVATLFGQIALSYLMRKAQRNSYIAFSIGGVVLLSAFLMTIQSMISMASGEKHHSGGICGKGD